MGPQLPMCRLPCGVSHKELQDEMYIYILGDCFKCSSRYQRVALYLGCSLWMISTVAGDVLGSSNLTKVLTALPHSAGEAEQQEATWRGL